MKLKRSLLYYFSLFCDIILPQQICIYRSKFLSLILQEIAIAKKPDIFYNRRKEYYMSHKKAKYTKKHKDRLFRFIFSQKAELLSLYNAVNGSNYVDENDLTIYTIEDFIYMGMKNDLSFLIDCHLNIYEHQSTYNPNMPIRGFFYMASALKKYVAAKNLDIYASSAVTIPVPQFYVFYNGTRNVPDEQILKLTDHMPVDKREKSCTQFLVTMININTDHNPNLLERCPKLYEYAVFISCIRKNTADGLTPEDAIGKAVTDCIHNNILAEILRSHKAEVTDMILDEYDENFHIACEKKLSYEEGRAAEKEHAQLSQNVLFLHLKHFSNEEIAQKLNVSIDVVQETLKELYACIPGMTV